MTTFFHEGKINQCALVYKRLNRVRSDYMLELLKQNIDIRSTERQSRYGSLNLICQKYKRESEGSRSFQVQGATSFQVSATRFGIYFPMKLRVALV